MTEVSEPEGVDPKPERNLPPIGRIRIPDEMKVMSTKIRWLAGLGYLPKEIYNLLGVRPQQVRNVLTTIPKRAAREDLPPLVVEVMELDGDLEAMDKHAMETEMAQQRAQARKGTGGTVPAEADLDDENYGR